MHNFLSNQVRSHQSSTAMFTLSDCKIWNHLKQIIKSLQIYCFYLCHRQRKSSCSTSVWSWTEECTEGGNHNKKHWKVFVVIREQHTDAQQNVLNWRKNWRNWLTRRGRPDGKSKKHCSSFHGLTWLVDSPEESSFTKARQLWGETSEISSLCYCWTDLSTVQIWALTD